MLNPTGASLLLAPLPGCGTIQNSFGMDIASAFVASIGTVLLSIHLALNSLSLRICPSSPSPDLCVFMGSSSDGPVSLMPILTLLELGINISVIAMWYKAKSRERQERLPKKRNSDSTDALPQVSAESELQLRTQRDAGSGQEIELSESPLQDDAPRESAASPPPLTWSTFLRRELEFLGVTQILIGFVCLCFGTIVHSVFTISDFDEEIFSSFNAGYPFWGPAFVRGRLGANTVSSLAAGTGIVLLVLNLLGSLAYISNCKKISEDEHCFVASFASGRVPRVALPFCRSQELVVMMLFLTVLGFCSAVSLTVYGIGEECRGRKGPEDRLYEELSIYSPIYSELVEAPEQASAPADS
ncbi:high affinity immunoglobulin epsilon receptor subunit beta-like [Ctenodactylus gundi]